MNDWINVNDGLPKDGELVKVLFMGNPTVAYHVSATTESDGLYMYSQLSKWVFSAIFGLETLDIDGYVTRWKPLSNEYAVAS